jgi:hypothetical protein
MEKDRDNKDYNKFVNKGLSGLPTYILLYRFYDFIVYTTQTKDNQAAL